MSDITYSWVISQLDCAPSEGLLQHVVKTIHWRYQVTDGTYTAETYSSVAVGAVDPEDFVAYSELTQEHVITWLESSLDVEVLQDSLAGQIAALITPASVTLALPWE